MLFFIHVPKAAGTSLRAALKRPLKDNLVLVYPGEPGCEPEEVVNRTLTNDAMLFGHFSYGLHEQVGTTPNYATVLRDPVERVASWYDFMRTNPRLAFYEQANRESLAAMVRSGNPQLCNHMTAIIAGRPIDGPNDREALEAAKRNLSQFVFVSTQERLADDLPRLGRYLGVSLRRLPKRNVGKRSPLSDDDKRAIREANALDLELFDLAEDAVGNIETLPGHRARLLRRFQSLVPANNRSNTRVSQRRFV